MIRPFGFRKNEQTAGNNLFQKDVENLTQKEITQRTQIEFDQFVKKLRGAGVDVIVVEDTPEPDTPDAVFPNNWISFHRNGNVALYPLYAKNRRAERRMDILDLLEEKGFVFNTVIDYSSAEQEGVYLEGTGSMVLDWKNRKAYCALSPRSDEALLFEFCEDFEYTPVPFHAHHTKQANRKPIYHTNVLMALTERYAIVCLESITNKSERKQVLKHLKADGKEVIAITEAQMNHFAGNMLQIMNDKGEKFLIMSQTAFEVLTDTQKQKLESESTLLTVSIPLIEQLGGGSVRCMIAEIFSKKIIV